MVGHTAYEHVAIHVAQTDAAAIIGGKALIFPVEHTVGRQALEDGV